MQWFQFNLSDFSISFLSILFEGVPFMFLGTLIAGLVDAFLPAGAAEKVLPRHVGFAVAVSGVLGVIFPMCECGVVPVIRRMVLKGMPVSCALTYLLAAPIVNPVVAVSTFAAFRGQHPWQVASLRLVLGYGIASLVGLLVSRLPLKLVLNRMMLQQREKKASPAAEPALAVAGHGHAHHECCGHDHEHDHKHEHDECCGHDHDHEEPHHHHHHHHHEAPGFGAKLLAAFRCTGLDFLEVGMYLIIGAALASLFNTAVNQQVVAPLASHGVWAIGAMMLLAMTLSLCSTSDAFIAANFLTFPLSAKMAFMVLGPMMDLKLIFMYGMVFRRRFTLALALGLFLIVGLICLVLGACLK